MNSELLILLLLGFSPLLFAGSKIDIPLQCHDTFLKENLDPNNINKVEKHSFVQCPSDHKYCYYKDDVPLESESTTIKYINVAGCAKAEDCNKLPVQDRSVIDKHIQREIKVICCQEHYCNQNKGLSDDVKEKRKELLLTFEKIKNNDIEEYNIDEKFDIVSGYTKLRLNGNGVGSHNIASCVTYLIQFFIAKIIYR
uniref:UPAR/Ly6 domain-containing protein n=1 Tax=Parastrongyloides trichosuri TaxID=131310 RepID=A0A0N4ZQ95_PARTI